MSTERTFPLRPALLLIGLALLLQACAAQRHETGREHYLRQAVEHHAVRDLETWTTWEGENGRPWRETPLAQRTAPAPAQLAEYLALDNELWGFSGVPEPASPPDSFSHALGAIMQELSPPLRRELKQRLIGVFAVRGLGSSGYAETVHTAGPGGTPVDTAMFIVLDVDEVAARSANDWASWKESTFFRHDPARPVHVRLTIEPDEGDTPENAVRFILLHEIGHVLGLFTQAHPHWTAERTVGPPPAGYVFPHLSWRQEAEDGGTGTWASRYADLYPDRKELAYYADAPAFDPAGVRGAYARLRRTDLPSLYALTSMWEDFAESFATYMHVVRAGRPWRLEVSDSQSAAPLVVESCWTGQRCAEKRTFMDAWFKAPHAASTARARD